MKTHINMIFTCSFPYTSSRTSSSTCAACSLITASTSLFASLTSAADGLDLPDGTDGVGPFVFVTDSPVFSIALDAAALDPDSVEGSLAFDEVV